MPANAKPDANAKRRSVPDAHADRADADAKRYTHAHTRPSAISDGRAITYTHVHPYADAHTHDRYTLTYQHTDAWAGPVHPGATGDATTD